MSAKDDEVEPGGEPEPDAEPEAEPEPAPEPEPEEDPEAEPEPEPEAEPSPEQQMTAIETALTKERDLHSKRLSKILGDASTHVLPCPFCFDGLQGFVYPGSGQGLDDDQREAAFALLGQSAMPDFEDAEGVSTCPRCKGRGQLRFPTHVEHTLLQTCPACQGAGYVVEQEAARPPAAPPPVLAVVPPQPSNGANACPSCGLAGMAGQPHYCQPQPTAVG
jgi:rubrerythrin